MRDAMPKDKPFNNPFGALKAKLEPEKPQAISKPGPAPAPAKKKEKVSSEDESALFLAAMGAFDEVRPVKKKANEPAPVIEKQERVTAADADALLELAELVIGTGELEIAESAGDVVGAPKGFDMGLFEKLPPVAELDVQALEHAAAKQAFERFVGDAQARRQRSVRVTMGAELRNMVLDALTRGKVARKVIAFRGSEDTVVVLLRRG
jgi:DNA-nicking Smr family endonuclease